MDTSERRKSRRVACACEARLEGIDVGHWDVRLSDLSTEGAFIDARSVLPSGTVADLRLTLDSQELRIRVEVKYSMSGFGMGVRFVDLDERTRRALEEAVARRA